MKYLITALALSSVLLANTQLQAHDSYLKDSSGAYVKNSAGECWKTGAYTSDEPACGSKTAMTPAPAKAAPVKWVNNLKIGTNRFLLTRISYRNTDTTNKHKGGEDIESKLKKLKKLFNKNLITELEYNTKRKEILSKY